MATVLKIVKRKTNVFIDEDFSSRYDKFIAELEIQLDIKSEKKSASTGSIVIELDGPLRDINGSIEKCKRIAKKYGLDAYGFDKNKTSSGIDIRFSVD